MRTLAQSIEANKARNEPRPTCKRCEKCPGGEKVCSDCYMDFVAALDAWEERVSKARKRKH